MQEIKLQEHKINKKQNLIIRSQMGVVEAVVLLLGELVCGWLNSAGCGYGP